MALPTALIQSSFSCTGQQCTCRSIDRRTTIHPTDTASPALRTPQTHILVPSPDPSTPRAAHALAWPLRAGMASTHTLAHIPSL